MRLFNTKFIFDSKKLELYFSKLVMWHMSNCFRMMAWHPAAYHLLWSSLRKLRVLSVALFINALGSDAKHRILGLLRTWSSYSLYIDHKSSGGKIMNWPCAQSQWVYSMRERNHDHMTESHLTGFEFQIATSWTVEPHTAIIEAPAQSNSLPD